jgi:SAM-dependent methyltransferase
MGELYDHIPAYGSRADIAFYVEQCRAASGEVLELGCGTGRILIPAAAAGCSITGVDQSRSMLAQCRTKLRALPPEVQQRITLVEADMTGFRIGRRFALATMPFRPFQHLVTVEEQLRCLQAISEHLEPGGCLVFDAFNPDLRRLVAPIGEDEIEDTPETPIPGGRTVRRNFRVVGQRRAEQVTDVELIYYVRNEEGQVRRIVQAFPMRYFFRYELEHLLARAGFEVAALYGDLEKQPFTDDSREMIFHAVKRGAPL